MGLRRILTAGLTTLVLACGGDIVKPSVRPPPPPPPQNRAPIITSTCPTQIKENFFYQCQLQASDPDGDNLSYQVIQSPDWLDFIGFTHSFFGRAPEISEDQSYTVEFQVSDNNGGSARQLYTIIVQNVSNTHVLTGDDLAKIVSVEEDKIVFSEPPDFEVGDIIVPDFGSSSSASAHFLKGAPTLADWPGCDYNPQGLFLRRIISWGADKLTAQTEPATIEEAVGNDLFSADEILSLPAGQTYSGIEGVSVSASPQGFGFNVDINNAILGEVGPFNQVVANGVISFNSRFILEGEVDGLRLQELLFQNKTTGRADITITSNQGLVLPEKEIELFECTLPTFLIYTPLGFPVYITPQLDVVIGMDDSRVRPFEFNVISEIELSPGIAYEDGSWRVLDDILKKDFTPSFSGPQGETNIKVYAGPRLTLLLYEALGPRAGIKGTLRLEANSDKDWKLYGGLEASLGIDMGIFSSFISDHDEPIDLGEKLLLSSEDIIEPPTTEQIAFVSTRDGNFDIYSMGEDGSNQRSLTNHIAADWYPSWSPDGTKIVFSSQRNARSEIYTMNSDGSDIRRLTNDVYQDILPKWSPNGSKILYISTRSGMHRLITMNSDGAQQSELETSLTADILSASWSPNGSQIVLTALRNGNWEVYTANANGTELVRITDNSFNDVFPVWSPQGDLIAFASDGDGTFDIYTMNINGGNVRRITNDSVNNLYPSWSPDGTEIIFVYNHSLSPTVNSEIYIIGTDGTGQRNLTNSPGVDSHPTWKRQQ